VSPGRAGNPLLGARVDDRARRLLVDHRLGEGVNAVDDAPKVDREHSLPAIVVVEGAAAGRGAGVVHQHVDRTERGIGTVFEAIYLIDLADIGRHGDELGAGQLRCGPVERVLAQIGEHQFHADRREALGRGEADAARTAGDDGNTAFAQRGMLRHRMLLLRMGLVAFPVLTDNSSRALSRRAELPSPLGVALRWIRSKAGSTLHAPGV
jgi:hypothetical protein